MSEILVHVPLSNQADFHPLALAPGLPMLDAKKLTYQVLLGWFGDLLAEPELDEKGVTFHVQRGGKREEIVERALATDADLDGPLSADFERLKQALFDVKPVSPSERLIFNRLQPPIGNYQGYLYRVRTQDGPERLVWCWGFQCRNTDAKATVCPNEECASLLMHVGEDLEHCPECRLTLLSSTPQRRRTRFPLGAATAITLLLAGIGGTVWVASSQGSNLEAIPGFSMLEKVGLNIPRELSASVEELSGSDVETALDSAVNPQPPSIILPDPTADPLESAVAATTDPAESTTKTDDSVGNDASGAPLATDQPRTQSVVQKPTPVRLSGNLERAAGEPPEPAPATTVGILSWEQDYLTAYKAATELRKPLLIVFRDTVDPESINSPSTGLAVPDLVPLLDSFVRLALPSNTTIPGQAGGTLLLEHRAFRHLNIHPGIAIVDLTDPESSWYGRVVSALPQPPNGRYSPELVRPLLQLPSGTVTHRSLLFALQNATPQSQFASLESTTTLNRLADRNCRFMAQYGQAGAFDASNRRAAVSTEFGETAQVRELFFASDDRQTIQDAAALAVEAWVRNPDDFRSLNGIVDGYGLEMFQSPESGRWFATLLIVIQP